MYRLDSELAADVRALNRIYRSFIDGLRVGYGGVSYSVTEGWVISELARQDAIEAIDLRHRLGIDAGYLSRVLSRFQGDRLVIRKPSPVDGRCQVVLLTPRGRAGSEAVDGGVARAVRRRLTGIAESDRQRIITAMATIRDVVENSRQGGRSAV